MGITKNAMLEQQAEDAIAQHNDYDDAETSWIAEEERHRAEAAEATVKLQAKIEAGEKLSEYDLRYLTRRGLIFLCLDSVKRAKEMQDQAQSFSNKYMTLKARVL